MKRARSSGRTTLWPSTERITSPPVRYGPALEADLARRRPRARPCRPGRRGRLRRAGRRSRCRGRACRRAAGRAPGWRRRCRRIRPCRPLRSWAIERFDRRDRDREADAVVGAGVGLDLLVDADHPGAGVEQRAAGVAGVDRGVGLDRALDLEFGQRSDRAVGRRDDPDRERLLLAEGAADRRHRLADDEARCRRRARAGAGRSRSGRPSSRATSAKGSKPTISAGTTLRSGNSTKTCFGRLALAARFVGDDVGVGDDLAVRVEDEAGALGGAGRAAEDRADRDHAGRRLVVDLGGVEAAARRSRRSTCGVRAVRRSSCRTLPRRRRRAGRRCPSRSRRAAPGRAAPRARRAAPPHALRLGGRAAGAAAARLAARPAAGRA